MIFVDVDQGSEAWHQARAGVITASTFGTALEITGGLTEQQQKYVTATLAGKGEAASLQAAGYKNKPLSESVARALLGQPVGTPSAASETLASDTAIERISKAPYGDTFQTFAMRRGSEMEAFARMRYESRYKTIVDESGLVLTDDRLFGYSTDGFVGESGMIEIKTPLNSQKIVQMIATGNIDEYVHQIQGGLWITGREWCDFCMYVPPLKGVGNDLYVKRIFRDDNFIDDMVTGLLKFEGRVGFYVDMLTKPFGVPA